MEVGRSLDVEIARQVVRLAVVLDPDGDAHRIVDPLHKKIVPLPYYSSNESDTYLLINMLQGQGFTCQVNSNVASGEIVWSVVFSRQTERGIGQSHYSMEHAACLAALDLVATGE